MQHGHRITIKCGSLLQEILENGRDEDLLVGVEGEAETGIQATIFYLTLIFLSFFFVNLRVLWNGKVLKRPFLYLLAVLIEFRFNDYWDGIFIRNDQLNVPNDHTDFLSILYIKKFFCHMLPAYWSEGICCVDLTSFPSTIIYEHEILVQFSW